MFLKAQTKGKSAVKEDKEGGNSRTKSEKGGNTTIARKISRKINEYPDVSLWPRHFPSRPKLRCNYNTVHTDPEVHTLPRYSVLF